MQDELLYRYLRNEATPDEIRHVRDWAAASEVNQHQLQELAVLLDVLTPVANAPVRAAPDPARLIQEGVARRAAGSAGWPGVPGRPRSVRYASLVAASLAAVALGWWLHTVTVKTSAPSAVVEEFITGPDERATVRLVDGSVVRLAPRTRLDITAWDDDERRLSLDGRAYFAVAHEPDRPFEIATRAGEVRVLGTRFEVNTQETAMRVVVVAGVVSLKVPRHEEVLVERDEVGLVVGGSTSITRHENAGELVDWVGRFLAFQKTPLLDALAEIERTYGVRTELTDPELADQTVTGLFVDRPLEDLLETLSLILDTRWVRDDGVVRVGP